jgi:hypothetical protein
LGYDANQAGLYLLLFFAGFAPAAQIGGRMLDRAGSRRPMVLGSVLGTVGFALWAGKLTDLHLGAQWPFILMSGAGIGLLLGPASTDAVNRAINASYGEVTGITQTVRNYGSALGIAVLGTVLTTVLTNRLATSLQNLGLPHATARSVAQRAAREQGAAALRTAGVAGTDPRRGCAGLRYRDRVGLLRDGDRSGPVLGRRAEPPRRAVERRRGGTNQPPYDSTVDELASTKSRHSRHNLSVWRPGRRAPVSPEPKPRNAR